LSQERLANSTKISFQQLQKYEKASNRVSASRLLRIAKALDVPVAAFFDSARVKPRTVRRARISGGRLLRGFNAVSDPEVRRALIEIVEQLTRSKPRD
jgi:transcriptional regulator with XRE-family HTH domain